MGTEEQIEDRKSDEFYATMLQNAGVAASGARIMDVGTCGGSFVKYARTVLGAAESWGCEHCPIWVEQGLEKGAIEPVDREKIVIAPFSTLLTKPELKNHFDIVKITAVTPYASQSEMKAMAATSHHLLKPTGTLLIELPWMNQMGLSMQADGKVDGMHDFLSVMEKGLRSRSLHKKIGRSSENFKEVYRLLARLYFSQARGFVGRDDSGEVLVASGPRPCGQLSRKRVATNLAAEMKLIASLS